MPKHTEDETTDRTVRSGPGARPGQSPQTNVSEDAQRDAQEEEKQPQDVREIPDPDALRTVTQQVTINIGVLGNIQGGTVSAAGQASQSNLGDAVAQAGVTRWQVRKEELHRLHQVFVLVPSVTEPATKILESRHVLILQGRMHWGKAATAQWLLTHLHHDQVFIIDPGDDRKLSDLTDSLDGDGYVLDTLSKEHATQLRPATLLRLAEHLQEPGRLGHLVITVDALTSLPIELADYVVVCQKTPDAGDVLWRHLVWEVGDDDATKALTRAGQWPKERLRNAPPPGRIRDLAAALATMVRRDGRLKTAEQDYQRRVLAYVAEWFRQHPGPRERCFMTAAAVLNGATYQAIAHAADQLERLVRGEITGSGPIPRGWSRPFSPRQERVEDIGAKLLEPAYGSGGGPLAMVELEEPLVQGMVLAHLWYQHDDIFSHLFEWLDDLGHEPFQVSGRAAAAASTLCVIDFPYLHDRLLRPWATDRDHGGDSQEPARTHTSRISAAVALATAARDPAVAGKVLDLLRRWSGPYQATGLPWTAATAFGLLDDENFLPDVLMGLRTIAEHHQMLSWVVARSLANLCEAGYVPDALRAVAAWVNPPPPAPTGRALAVFDRLMRVQADQPQDDQVPVLLNLAATQKQAAKAMRQLWRDLLTSPRPEVEETTLNALHDWLLLADDDNDRLCPALDVMLRPLLLQQATWRRTRRALRRCAFKFEPKSRTAAELLRATGDWLDRTLDWTYMVSSRISAAWRSWVDRRTV